MALVTVLQFLEGLSDRQAAEAVRARIDWKYALSLELEDAGFDFSVLCEFRARLVAGGQEMLLLDRMLARFAAQGLLAARGRQRTDSTHVLGAVRSLNRLTLLVETMRAALNALATAAPDWLRGVAPPVWYDRYAHRAEEYRLPRAAAARAAYAQVVGVDGTALLDALAAPDVPPALAMLAAVTTLRDVWAQQFEPTGPNADPPTRVSRPRRAASRSSDAPPPTPKGTSAGAPPDATSRGARSEGAGGEGAVRLREKRVSQR